MDQIKLNFNLIKWENQEDSEAGDWATGYQASHTQQWVHIYSDHLEGGRKICPFIQARGIIP